MKKLGLIFLCQLILSSCKIDSKTSTNSSVAPSVPNCKGIYYTTDTDGKLRKWKEWLNESSNQCFNENMALPQWFVSLEQRKLAGKKCLPQPGFPEYTGITTNNYYKYRDGRELINFNPGTGEYRKIFLAEEKKYTPNGTLDINYQNNGFAKELGCFAYKEDATTGNWIHLDNEYMVNTSYFQPSEIYQYTFSGLNLILERKDEIESWSGKFCPWNGTPWEYCTLLRNGNIMFGPDLTTEENAILLKSATLIRTKFNFDSKNKQSFEKLWTDLDNDILFENPTNLVLDRANWKYDIDFVIDTPRFTWQAMVDFIYGYRPILPAEYSNQQMICYDGARTVILQDGSSGVIQGEICYENGKYSFTAN